MMDIKNDQNTVTFNLRGRIFVTCRKIFLRIPESKLNQLTLSNPAEREFYFDRNPVLFDNILDVFKSGEFHIPNDICGTVILNELDFWSIPKFYTAKCCMKTYSCYLEEKRMMKEIDHSFKMDNISKYPSEMYLRRKNNDSWNQNEVSISKSTNDHRFATANGSYDSNRDSLSESSYTQIDLSRNENSKYPMQRDNNPNESYSLSNESNSYGLRKSYLDDIKPRRWLYYVQTFLEDPFSSKPALVWGCFFMLLVITSVAIQCLATHPNFRVPNQKINVSLPNINVSATTNKENNKEEPFTTVLSETTVSSTNNDNVGNVVKEEVTQSISTANIPDNILSLTQNMLVNNFQSNTDIVSNCQNNTDAVQTKDKKILNSTNIKLNLYWTTERHPVLTIIQYVCLIAFTLEILIRFIICQDRKCFILNFYNIVDLLALVPTVTLELMVIFSGLKVLLTNDVYFKISFFLSTMGVFKTLRLVKFFRHFNAMKVLLLALRASLREISLLFLLITIGMLIFSTLIYHTEFYTDDFQTIPIGFWWSIVTMTTVGYGDTHPTTAWGYLVGAMCALAGMLSTGLPIPIIANNFNLYYTYAKVHMCDLRIRTNDQHNSEKILNKMAFENKAINKEEGTIEVST